MTIIRSKGLMKTSFFANKITICCNTILFFLFIGMNDIFYVLLPLNL